MTTTTLTLPRLIEGVYAGRYSAEEYYAHIQSGAITAALMGYYHAAMIDPDGMIIAGRSHGAIGYQHLNYHGWMRILVKPGEYLHLEIRDRMLTAAQVETCGRLAHLINITQECSLDLGGKCRAAADASELHKRLKAYHTVWCVPNPT